MNPRESLRGPKVFCETDTQLKGDRAWPRVNKQSGLTTHFIPCQISYKCSRAVCTSPEESSNLSRMGNTECTIRHPSTLEASPFCLEAGKFHRQGQAINDVWKIVRNSPPPFVHILCSLSVHDLKNWAIVDEALHRSSVYQSTRPSRMWGQWTGNG